MIEADAAFDRHQGLVIEMHRRRLGILLGCLNQENIVILFGAAEAERLGAAGNAELLLHAQYVPIPGNGGFEILAIKTDMHDARHGARLGTLSHDSVLPKSFVVLLVKPAAAATELALANQAVRRIVGLDRNHPR